MGLHADNNCDTMKHKSIYNTYKCITLFIILAFMLNVNRKIAYSLFYLEVKHGHSAKNKNKM